MSKAKLLVGHNICQYDLIVLEMLYGWVPSCPVFDTLVAGNILMPEEVLSLETWAKKLRLKVQKVQHEDWTTYSPDMGRRCQADVSINLAVYRYLLSHKDVSSIEEGLHLEQEVARIHAKQTLHMVSFDIQKGIELLQLIDTELEELEERILKEAPWHTYIPGTAKVRQAAEKEERSRSIEEGKPVKCTKAFTNSGAYSKITVNYFGEDLYKVKGPYTKVEIVPTNLNNPADVKELLYSLGWIPDDWNIVKQPDGTWKKTSPKLTESSYESLPEGLGKDIARYNTLKHRRNFLLSRKDNTKGALAQVLKYDGRVPAHAFTCGTPTARYRHSGVVCNIPRVTSVLGEEVRALFRATPGNYQVGMDLARIEARMLAHYLLVGKYTGADETVKLILSEDKSMDFHTANAKAWGVDRDTAKSILYALMYGASGKKLAQIAGRKESQGQKIKEEFYDLHPGIKELIDDLDNAVKQRGHLIALDGRPLYIRESYKALNSLLQNAAAIYFKHWMVQVDRAKNDQGFSSCHQMIAYHDELQFDCDVSNEEAEKFAKMVTTVALMVGEYLGIRVPTAAEAKIGRNWRDCH